MIGVIRPIGSFVLVFLVAFVTRIIQTAFIRGVTGQEQIRF